MEDKSRARGRGQGGRRDEKGDRGVSDSRAPVEKMSLRELTSDKHPSSNNPLISRRLEFSNRR